MECWSIVTWRFLWRGSFGSAGSGRSLGLGGNDRVHANGYWVGTMLERVLSTSGPERLMGIMLHRSNGLIDGFDGELLYKVRSS